MPSTSDCACGEKPRPPCSLEMSMPRKPCFLTKSQISSGISLSVVADLPVVDHPAELVASGPSRNAFSSSVSVIGGTARSFSQSGVPENSSASKPMVPALSASCSVAETLGRMPLILWKSGLDQRSAADGRRRQARRARSPAPRPAGRAGRRSARRTRRAACPSARRRWRPPGPGAQAHRGACRMASTNAPAMQRARNTSSAMVCRSPRRRPARRRIRSRNSRP